MTNYKDAQLSLTRPGVGRLQGLLWVTLLILGLLTLAMPASADTAYSENFHSGKSLASDPLVNLAGIDGYWLNAGEGNGIVAKCTGGGSCYASGNPITTDANGSDYFLFENTAGDNYDYNGSAGPDTFFASSTFNVNPGTYYTVSFALANATTCCYADVQAVINGSTVGTPVLVDGPSVNANGYTQWQTFRFTWYSGSNTTANLNLLDYSSNGYGNDFGVDNILVATPEPGSFVLFGSGLLGLAGAIRRKIRK